jgi:predicted negative regulator of RcsB-dependent stress response
LADTLKADFAATTYAQFGALFKAKLAVQNNDLAQAESELRWVLEHKPAQEIKLLAQLRLARVLHAKDDNAGALALLDEKTAGGYAAAFLQLKGDIANAGGDFAAARSAYEQAQELERKQANPVNDPLLEMKLRDLSVTALNGESKTAADSQAGNSAANSADNQSDSKSDNKADAAQPATDSER